MAGGYILLNPNSNTNPKCVTKIKRGNNFSDCTIRFHHNSIFPSHIAILRRVFHNALSQVTL